MLDAFSRRESVPAPLHGQPMLEFDSFRSFTVEKSRSFTVEKWMIERVWLREVNYGGIKVLAFRFGTEM